MIANSTIPRLNFLPSQRWDSVMLSNSYIKVSYTFTILPFWRVQFLDFNYLIVTSFTFIGKCLNKLKLDICVCSSQDITIALCLVMTLALISFFCFCASLSMRVLVFHLEYHCILLRLIRLTNCLKMGWSISPKRRKNTWFSGKIK